MAPEIILHPFKSKPEFPAVPGEFLSPSVDAVIVASHVCYLSCRLFCTRLWGTWSLSHKHVFCQYKSGNYPALFVVTNCHIAIYSHEIISHKPGTKAALRSFPGLFSMEERGRPILRPPAPQIHIYIPTRKIRVAQSFLRFIIYITSGVLISVWERMHILSHSVWRFFLDRNGVFIYFVYETYVEVVSYLSHLWRWRVFRVLVAAFLFWC